MYSINVNGKIYETEEDKKLIRFLRDDLRLTSVKDGCSQGACGTCTVIVDGKTQRACVSKLSKLDGRSVVTVEGMTDREKDVFSYAFAKVGAVQCGFCIPGMVLSGKALIDKNPDPNRIEVMDAIKTNICRCTGYKKIIDGILLAAKMLRKDLPTEEEHGTVHVGTAMQRVDAYEKVNGTGIYCDDIYLDGMIYGSAVRSEFPRARVLAIHTEKAKALPGVVGVFTADDIPGSAKVGHLKQDWDALVPVGKMTHTLGDPICLVAAETPEIMKEAKKLIEVEYEELEGVFDPHEAIKEGAVKVHESEKNNILAHEHLVRGDADKAISESKYKVTKHYETPWTEHAFLEPECAVAMPYDEDGVFIYSSDQGTYDTQHECMLMLGLPAEKVVVENALVGGGFGGKEDVSVQHHAALIAYLTKRSVKVKLTRDESLEIHPKRHPFSMDVTLACDNDGHLTAIKVKALADTGAYASLGGPVLQRACTHAAGPYNYQIIDIDGTAVYTNNPPAGAFRGFGVTQTIFAVEMNMDILAGMIGVSPWEMRYRNALRPGDIMPNGQIAGPETAFAETLEAVKDIYDEEVHVGIGCALKNAGVGVGIPDWGRCRLVIKNGNVDINVGGSCMGQGLGTVLVQILSETAKVPVEKIIWEHPNTSKAPDSGTSSASRHTVFSGEACRRASEKLKKALEDKTLDELDGEEFYAEYLGKTDPMGADVTNPVSHVAYGYATQLCVLNDDGTIKKMVASHDVGTAINRASVEGQIEGGVVMGMGFALTEHYKLDHGQTTSKYGTLGLFKANNVPEIDSIVIEKPGVPVACGAIGIGEITCIPTAPAIAGAYYALTGKLETSLPLQNTPYAPKKK